MPLPSQPAHVLLLPWATLNPIHILNYPSRWRLQYAIYSHTSCRLLNLNKHCKNATAFYTSHKDIMVFVKLLDYWLKFLRKHKGDLLNCLLYFNRLKELNFCYQREGRSIFEAKDMHHLWQQCTVHLPVIDFELEMLVHCVVNGMRLYAVPFLL